MAVETRRRPLALVIAAAFAAAASFGGLLVLGALRPPAFPALADAPDPRIPGKVAFWDAREPHCLRVVDASGGTVRRLSCDDALSPDIYGLFNGEDLEWTPEGNLFSVHRVGGDRERLTIDARTGAVLDRRLDEPGFGPSGLVNSRKAPDGTRAVTEDHDGTAVLRLHPPEGSPRTLLEVTGPRDYAFERPFIWSTDSAWLLATDSANRLLIVAADTGLTRVLATNATSPAWSSGHKCHPRLQYPHC